MKNFNFEITQSMSSFYRGKINIEANSKKEAKDKILQLTNSELEDLVEEWEISLEDINIKEPIEVWNNGKLIHQPLTF